MQKKIIIANWKMNPATAGEAMELAEKIERAAAGGRRADVIIAPPFPFLAAVGAVLSRARLGAQDAFWEESGPYTGEVSARQLKNLGVTYVIIGHSERRIYLGETDEMVSKKTAAVAAAGMTAVLCIGERERQGRDVPAVVEEQVNAALVGLHRSLLGRLIVAYEPAWAISTAAGSAGADLPERIFRARLTIEKTIAALHGSIAAKKVRVIYGGSVNPENVAPIMNGGRMDGVLVGGASADAAALGGIVRAAADVVRR